ncbi:ROK family protein [Nocardioides houyundeii]|uniref:ROK family protein n=1 Tax=Nocardioides houyundeii TaxID=2045452 RepID=UPI000C763E98|nr:ROK family protein [Nocardioides houyundeii]
MSAPVWIGVDVGGTKILAGVVSEDGAVLRSAGRPTPGRLAEVRHLEDALTEAVLEAAHGAPLAAVGLAAAGFVDSSGDRVMFAPHLPWRDEQVRTRLSERWSTPVFLDNDANCAAVGEREHGAARGASSVLMVTLGTGIGGALLVGDTLVRGAGGMAGEFGHMRVVPGGLPCECGGRGCWEQYCSGNALLRAARASLTEGPTLLTELCAGDPARLTGPMVGVAAGAGDRSAIAAFTTVGEWLGAGLANLTAAFDPARVVVGGGLAAAGAHFLGRARDALASSLVGAGHRALPPIVVASLGAEAGLVGATVQARRQVEGTPAC